MKALYSTKDFQDHELTRDGITVAILATEPEPGDRIVLFLHRNTIRQFSTFMAFNHDFKPGPGVPLDFGIWGAEMSVSIPDRDGPPLRATFACCNELSVNRVVVARYRADDIEHDIQLQLESIYDAERQAENVSGTPTYQGFYDEIRVRNIQLVTGFQDGHFGRNPAVFLRINGALYNIGGVGLVEEAVGIVLCDNCGLPVYADQLIPFTPGEPSFCPHCHQQEIREHAQAATS